MSGGYFDYIDSTSLSQIIDGLKEVLHDNNSQKKVVKDYFNEREYKWEQYESWEPQTVSDNFGTNRWVHDYRLNNEQVKLLEDTIFDCEILREKLHSIDWRFSGDTSKEDMEKDLKNLTKKQIDRYSQQKI